MKALDAKSLLLWLIAGYLIGSFPTAYVAAKLTKGIDLRDFGSGNVGGSNAIKAVSFKVGAAVALTDAAKGMVPAIVALLVTGSLLPAVAVGTGVTIGHCWSLYLGFTGGRGMSAALGAIFPIFPVGPVWVIAVHIAGSFLHRSALADMVALITLPLVAHLATGEPALVLQAVAILIIVSAKRLHANLLPLPRDPQERRRVLWRRLLYDRDVPPDQPWTERVHIRQSPPD